MPRKQRAIHEIVQILAEGLSGYRNKREVCRKHGITEQTFYRWLKQYPRAREAHEAFIRSNKTGYLRLLQAMSEPQGDSNTPSEDSDLESYHDVPIEVLASDPSLPEDQEDTDGEILTTPAVAYDTSFRDRRYRVKVHGRLPRGEFEFVQIALANDLHQRLKKTVDGSLNQAMVGLVRYALDVLDRDQQTLHLFDASLRKPQLPSKEPMVKILKNLKR